MNAGYETTATTLSFCSYELALNPECQEKLYEEINSAIDSNGEISYEALATLPYLDSVISETLRLYPPIIKLEREPITDYKLGDTGITLFKGQIVEIPVYAIHHSEEYYPNPENFNPSRFMPQNRDQIIPYTYLPFGAGPRNCIGMRFALMETKLCLAQIVRRYKFVRSVKTEIPLQFKKVSLLLSTNGLIVGIQKR
jgi:cytochrome P450